MLLHFSHTRMHVGERNEGDCNCWCPVTGFSHFFSEWLWILSVSHPIPVQEAQLKAGRSAVHLFWWPHSQKSWSEKSHIEGEAVSGWVLLWRSLFSSICSLSVRKTIYFLCFWTEFPSHVQGSLKLCLRESIHLENAFALTIHQIGIKPHIWHNPTSHMGWQSCCLTGTF